MTTRKLCIFTIVLFCELLVGCNHCSDINPEKCPEYSNQQELKTISIYMDISGSMTGFLKGGSEFQQFISELLTELENPALFNKLSVKPYLIGNNADERLRMDTLDRRNFKNSIQNANLNFVGSSILQDLIQTSMENCSEEAVSIFITDGIMSRSDSKIRINSDVNREQRLEMKNEIKELVLREKVGNLEVGIMHLSSNFTGTYYDFENGKHDLLDVQRPYFMICFGRNGSLDDFLKKIQKAPFYNEKSVKNDIYFGHKKSSSWLFKEKGSRSGVCIHNECGINNGAVTLEKEEGVFILAIENSEFGSNPNLESFQVASSSPATSVKLLEIRNALDNGNKQDSQRAMELKLNTFFVIEVKNVKSQTTLTISHLSGSPKWISSLSTDDDRQEHENTVFAFEYFYKGFSEAYYDMHLKGIPDWDSKILVQPLN